MLRFIKDFFIYGFSSVIGKIAAVFLMPIYTNILTKEEYGALALITSCKGIIDLFSNLNIHTGVARDYYDETIERTKLISTGFFSIVLISCFVCCAMLLSQEFWMSKILGLENKHAPAFSLMLLSIPAGSLLSFFGILTRFKKKALIFSLGTLLQLTVQITITIYGVVILQMGIVSMFVGLLSGEIICLLFFFFINRKSIIPCYCSRYLKRVLIFSLPTLPAILAGWIDSSLGQIIIGKNISQEALGVYSIALQFASMFSLIGLALNNAWPPFLYENYKKHNFQETVTLFFNIVVILLCTLSIVVSLFSKEIICCLSNSGYESARFYFTLLCFPMCVYLLFPFASSGISISRDTKFIGIAYVSGGLSNIIGLITLIPLFSVIAVPFSLSISRVISYIILSHASKKKNVLTLPNYPLVILAITVCASYCIQIIDVSIEFRVLISLLFSSISAIYVYLKIKDNYSSIC